MLLCEIKSRLKAVHTMQTFEGTEFSYHQRMYLQCVHQAFAFLHYVLFLVFGLEGFLCCHVLL